MDIPSPTDGDGAAQYREGRGLLRLSPLSEVARVALAQAPVAIGRAREAAALLEHLDVERPGPHGEWRYYTTLATALYILGDYRRELKTAEDGRQRHPEQHFLLWAEVRALAAFGRVDDRRDRVDEPRAAAPDLPYPGLCYALRRPRARSPRSTPGGAVRLAARCRMDQRNPPPKNLAPARRAAPVAILYGAGRWTEAEAAARRLATEEPERPEHQAWLGFLAARQGRRSEADQIAAGLAARRGPYLRGRHTLGRAAIAAGLGQRQQAITLLQQALTEGQEYSVRLHADLWFASLRGYPPFEELLRPKG